MNKAHLTSKRHRGFTLIELMVAMLLGLITTLIIAEVMLKSEGNRRTTTDGSDAQLNGAMALYTMQRDITMAGYGIISTNTVLGCEVRGKYGNNAAHSFTLAPVVITAGASGDVSDSITVLRSGSNGYAVPIVTTGTHANTDTFFNVQSTLGVSLGDLMLAMPVAPDSTHWCTMFTVNAGATSSLTATTIPNETATTSWSPAATNMPTSYASGSMLAKISQLVYRRFSVSSNDLVSTDLITDTDGTATNTIGPQIVLLKAYYGKDINADGAVDTYDTTTPTTTAGWLQIKTIRIAVVARSAQREKDAVTTTNPLWDVGKATSVINASACGASKCMPLEIHPASGADTEWQHYRYKVYDTVIPLRNMLWTS